MLVIAGDLNLAEIDREFVVICHNEDSKEAKFLKAVQDSFLTQNIDKLTKTRSKDQLSPLG